MRAQIAVIDSKVVIFIGIIKMDDKNFMIVNKKGEIDSFGLDFSKYMSNEGNSVRADRIFPKWKSILPYLSKDPITIRTPLENI